MADLYVKEFDMINPFVIASSPATQGARNVLKSAKSRPGALVLRNFGHGMGGGSYFYPDAKAVFSGQPAFHSHAVGTQVKDPVTTLEQYCEEVRTIKKAMDQDIKLWVSVGHYSDIIKGGAWLKDWVEQAQELERAGADAVELHFNTPGVAAAGNRNFNYYQLVSNCVRAIKKAVSIPVMCKLAVEGCDPMISMRLASDAGADAIGPTARWKAFYFDLDWRRTQPRPGAGYGGTQATPIVCYSVAEARTAGIDTPMYAGGGVFSHIPALQLVMAGSQCVQLGAIACSGGVKACERIIKNFGKWMDDNGYHDIESLRGDALKLYSMPGEVAAARTKALGTAYKVAQVDADKCIGCTRCVDVCWHEGIEMVGKKAVKQDPCIGCGYCFQVCPSGALHVESGDILASVFPAVER